MRLPCHEVPMFWNKIAGLYDLFENIYNKKVYTGTGKKVAEYINSEDEVLECACGTGAISIYIAEKMQKEQSKNIIIFKSFATVSVQYLTWIFIGKV